MRDILVTVMIFGLLPLIWKQPWTGVLAWLWISIMNPHRFAFGFANAMPFAAIIVVVTVVSMLKARDQVKLPLNTTVLLFVLLPVWMCVTTFFCIRTHLRLPALEGSYENFLFSDCWRIPDTFA